MYSINIFHLRRCASWHSLDRWSFDDNFCLSNPSHVDTNTFCSTATSNYNGVECPNYCPTTCGPDQFMCEPDYDSNGCPMKPVCVPMDPCGDSSSQCPKTNDYQGCPVQPGKTFKNCPLFSVVLSKVSWSANLYGSLWFRGCPAVSRWIHFAHMNVTYR